MFKDRLIFVSLLAAAILNIILWLAGAGKFGWSLERVPLHFNIVYGIDVLAPARQIFVLPLTGAFLLGLNAVLAAFLYQEEKFYSYILVFSALLIQAVLLLGVFVITVFNA